MASMHQCPYRPCRPLEGPSDPSVRSPQLSTCHALLHSPQVFHLLAYGCINVGALHLVKPREVVQPFTSAGNCKVSACFFAKHMLCNLAYIIAKTAALIATGRFVDSAGFSLLVVSCVSCVSPYGSPPAGPASDASSCVCCLHVSISVTSCEINHILVCTGPT
jgi:hypothetical protein